MAKNGLPLMLEEPVMFINFIFVRRVEQLKEKPHTTRKAARRL